MSKAFNKGDRVTLPNHEFLSDGVIKKIHFSPVSSKPFAATVKLDEKAPNEYAWETDEVFMYFSDMELVKCSQD